MHLDHADGGTSELGHLVSNHLVRRKAGIGARSRDFGRTMLVCRMEHEGSHGQIASEWFDYGQTLALLPLNGNRSSAVITVPGSEARRLQQLDAEDFSIEVERRYRGRMGWMRRIGEVFAYPLVAVMADRFTADEIDRAASEGQDIGAPGVLAAYERGHLRATLPLYFGTNALVSLYTSASLPARLVRGALVRLGNEVRPFKRALATSLTRPRVLHQ